MSLFSTKKLHEVQEKERREVIAKKHTVMIVDDEAPNLRILATMLSPHYHIVEAHDGRDALNKIKAGDYPAEISLVISDQRMPNMTGTELFKKLITVLPKAKRIILTGYTDMDVILDTINECRIFKFILKPFDQMDLALTVSRALEAFEMEARLETHRRELEQKVAERTRELLLQEKLASIGRLTAGLAHELRNPLNFVKPMAEALPEQCEELKERMVSLNIDLECQEMVDDIIHGLEVIRKNADRADVIVNSMVRLSDDGTTERETVDIHRMLKEHAELALSGMRAQNHDFSVEMSMDLAPESRTLGGVAQNLNRLFLSLLTNAMEALFDKWIQQGDAFAPKLAVTARGSDTEVAVVIHDNGVGIPEKIGDQVMEPFVSTKSPDAGNLGLGLFISYEIVEDHKGKIEIRSEEGVFTEITLSIPRQ